MELLGQGLDLSCSCSNAGSLTHCAELGIEPTSQSSQDAADPIAPQQELLNLFFIVVTLVYDSICFLGSAYFNLCTYHHALTKSFFSIRHYNYCPISPSSLLLPLLGPLLCSLYLCVFVCSFILFFVFANSTYE